MVEQQERMKAQETLVARQQQQMVAYGRQLATQQLEMTAYKNEMASVSSMLEAFMVSSGASHIFPVSNIESPSHVRARSSVVVD